MKCWPGNHWVQTQSYTKTHTCLSVMRVSDELRGCLWQSRIKVKVCDGSDRVVSAGGFAGIHLTLVSPVLSSIRPSICPFHLQSTPFLSLWVSRSPAAAPACLHALGEMLFFRRRKKKIHKNCFITSFLVVRFLFPSCIFSPVPPLRGRFFSSSLQFVSVDMFECLFSIVLWISPETTTFLQHALKRRPVFPALTTWREWLRVCYICSFWTFQGDFSSPPSSLEENEPLRVQRQGLDYRGAAGRPSSPTAAYFWNKTWIISNCCSCVPLYQFFHQVMPLRLDDTLKWEWENCWKT